MFMLMLIDVVTHDEVRSAAGGHLSVPFRAKTDRREEGVTGALLV